MNIATRTKRICAAALASVMLAVVPLPADATTWPAQPVRIVVPYPAGAGAADVLSRRLGEKLAVIWKQPVIIDNRPGGSEIIGATAVANAKPDGYTLLLSTEAALETNQFLFSKLPYDSGAAFTPITRLAEGPYLFVVGANSSLRTFEQLVAAIKSRPGQVSYGSGGPGSPPHLAVEWFANTAGKLQLMHVPYKGAAERLQATLTGTIDFTASPVGPVLPLVMDKKLQALATTGSTRLHALPAVPTMAELGLPEATNSFMFALSGPAGMPSELANQIARDIASVLSQPGFREKVIEPLGLEAVLDTPAEFARFLTKNRDVQRARVRAANVKLD